jgi:NADH-quinone oxidoreductase subunit N
MIITSVVSYYYYFAIVRQMFMRTALQSSELVRSVPLVATLWICAVLSVLIGLFPQSVVGWIESIFVYEIDMFG